MQPCDSLALQDRFDSREDSKEDPEEGGAAYMLRVYDKVIVAGLSNYHRVHMQLPSNLHFREREVLACTEDDTGLIEFLKYGFPMGYEGLVPTPTGNNCTSAMQHLWNVATYMLTELEEGAMLGPFEDIPFIPWCQVNTLLTCPKKDSHVRRVIMDFSWPHPPHIGVNVCTPKDKHMGPCKKMKLPSASDLVSLIKEAGKGFYRF